MFDHQYASVFEGDERWRSLPTPDGATFEWDSESTYVRKPPYFDGMTIETTPVSDIVGLWKYLAKHGSQLGGLSAPRFLRMVGKDTFVPTDDMVAALKAQGVIDKAPTSLKDLAAVQAAFNQWQAESGRPLCQLSVMLAHTVNH